MSHHCIQDPEQFMHTCSLVMDANNAPMIAYSNGHDLRLARPASAYDLSSGNCGKSYRGVQIHTFIAQRCIVRSIVMGFWVNLFL
jgi:hypothetical protein